MKTNNKRPRQQMRARNKHRVNQLKKQQVIASPVFVMFLIRLGLEKQTTPEKLLARLRMHVEKLTGNATFPVISPTLIELGDMADDLEALIDQVNAGNNALIPDRDAAVADGEEMIRQLSYNIQFLSKGDDVKIKSAGFDVRKPKGASQNPGQVLNLVVKAVGPGKIKLSWDKDEHSTVYVIERQSGNGVPPFPVQWEGAGKTRNVSFVAEDLTPGQVYTFRVYGTNGNADGNPSDIAEQRCL